MRYDKGTYAVVMFASNPGTVHWISNSISDAPQEDRKGRKTCQGKTETAQQLFCF